MILHQWGKVWELYKSALSLKSIRSYWPLRISLGLYLASGIAGVILLTTKHWNILSVLGLMTPFGIIMWYTKHVALSKKFHDEYATHGIAIFPITRRIMYLRYALFLHRLAEHLYTREDIEKLRQFAEIVDRPTFPAIQVTDHPIIWLLFIVPFITGLWTLGTGLIKKTEPWREVTQETGLFLGAGVIIAIMAVGAFWIWQEIIHLSSRKREYLELQRFLQWAESDIKEMQLFRSRHLCAKIAHSQIPSC
jgi:hypothetical protein